ncbi:MAG TPA: hypothetical protein VFS32_09235 [Candidatus Limnocylindrales bacterium]|nr:hypothetical protein [Candidatus Limnocylindrales bacterium]
MPANRKFTDDEDTEGQGLGVRRKAVDDESAGQSSYGGARRKLTDDEDTEGQSGMLRRAIDDEDEVGPSGIANRK